MTCVQPCCEPLYLASLMTIILVLRWQLPRTESFPQDMPFTHISIPALLFESPLAPIWYRPKQCIRIIGREILEQHWGEQRKKNWNGTKEAWYPCLQTNYKVPSHRETNGITWMFSTPGPPHLVAPCINSRVSQIRQRFFFFLSIFILLHFLSSLKVSYSLLLDRFYILEQRLFIAMYMVSQFIRITHITFKLRGKHN